MTVRRLVMLRHGQTEYNAGNRMQGQLDTALSERGRRQATSGAFGQVPLNVGGQLGAGLEPVAACHPDQLEAVPGGRVGLRQRGAARLHIPDG